MIVYNFIVIEPRIERVPGLSGFHVFRQVLAHGAVEHVAKETFIQNVLTPHVEIDVFTGNTQIHVPKEIGILFHGVRLVKILGPETSNRRSCRERFE